MRRTSTINSPDHRNFGFSIILALCCAGGCTPTESDDENVADGTSSGGAPSGSGSGQDDSDSNPPSDGSEEGEGRGDGGNDEGGTDDGDSDSTTGVSGGADEGPDIDEEAQGPLLGDDNGVLNSMGDGDTEVLFRVFRSQLSVTAEVTAPATVEIAMQSDPDVPFASARLSADTPTTISVNVPRGAYQIRVVAQEEVRYTAEVEATQFLPLESEPEPGALNDASTVDLGAVGEDTLTIGGYTGTLDSEDAYRFELDNPATVELISRDMAGRVFAQIYQYDDVLGVDDFFARLDTASAGTSMSVDLPRGVFVLRVVPINSNFPHNLYAFSIESAAHATIENDPEPAGLNEVGTLDLGQIGEAVVEVGGYVGTLDDEDVFRFTLTDPATLDLLARDVSGRVLARIYQFDQTLGVDDFFASLDSANNALEVDLPRGEYALRVIRLNSNFAHNLYTLNLSASSYPTIEADPEPDDLNSSGRQELGVLGPDPVTFGGYVGGLDQEDAFRFDLATPGSLRLLARDVSGRILARIYENDSVLAIDDFFVSLDSGTGTATLDIDLPRGEYVLRTIRLNSNFTHNLYSLTAEVEPYTIDEDDPEPGALNSAQVRDLGPLSATPIEVGGYTGILDDEDVFRFELASSGTVELLATDVSGRVVAQIYEDAAVVDVADVVAQLDTANQASRSLDVDLAAGSYVVRVARINSNFSHNLYTLTLTQQVE